MPVYDMVLTNGRIVDPESRMDRVANVGITAGTVQAITGELLEGNDSIDAAGLVVAPGAIDLHSHGQDDENYRVQALDGVTTALELELGVLNVDEWYGERDGGNGGRGRRCRRGDDHRGATREYGRAPASCRGRTPGQDGGRALALRDSRDQ